MIIYLAAPYSSEDNEIINERVIKVNKKAAELMEKGYVVFSPITHGHEISKYTNIDPLDHKFWLNQVLPFLSFCDKLIVYRLPGWKESKGVRKEIDTALKLEKQIVFID